MSDHEIAAFVAEYVVPKFPNARRRGDWMDDCCPNPEHKDGRERRPSFGFNVNSGGFRCHACGQSGGLKELCTLLGLPPPFAKGASHPRTRRSGRPNVVKAYPYHGETSTLLFEVCRLDPKDFRLRRPRQPHERDADLRAHRLKADDAYVWSTTRLTHDPEAACDRCGGSHRAEQVQRVPYQLPALLAADPTAPIYITEGEKDADALVELGLHATTSAGGAGKWPSAMNHVFESRQIVIVPDNDEAGRKHAHRVARELASSAASVKIVTLPGLPEAGDVSDWLDQEHSREELEQRVADTPTWAPDTDTPASNDAAPERFRLYYDDELNADDGTRHLVAGMFSVGSLVLVHSDSGVGKSFLALDFSFSVASGMAWQGATVTQGPVVYVAAEGQSGLNHRQAAWKRHHGLDGQRVGVRFVKEPVDPLNKHDVDLLLERLRPERPVLIVIDTWAASLAVGGGDEDKTRDSGQAIAALRRLMTELGTSVLIAHHRGHGGNRARGSTALRAAADTEIGLTKNNGIITVKSLKQRDLPDFADIEIRLRSVTLDEGSSSCVLVSANDPNASAAPHPSPRAVTALAALERVRPTPSNRAAWIKESGQSESTFDRGRRELLDLAYVKQLETGAYHITQAGNEYLHRHHRQTTVSDGPDSQASTTATNGHTPIRGDRGDGEGGVLDDGGSFPSATRRENGSTPADTVRPSWWDEVAHWPEERRIEFWELLSVRCDQGLSEPEAGPRVYAEIKAKYANGEQS